MKKKQPRKTVHGKIFGHTIGSVCRRLGKEGLSVEQVTKILKARGFETKPLTIRFNVNSGNGDGHYYGEPADLTHQQLAELAKYLA